MWLCAWQFMRPRRGWGPNRCLASVEGERVVLPLAPGADSIVEIWAGPQQVPALIGAAGKCHSWKHFNNRPALYGGAYTLIVTTQRQ